MKLPDRYEMPDLSDLFAKQVLDMMLNMVVGHYPSAARAAQPQFVNLVRLTTWWEFPTPSGASTLLQPVTPPTPSGASTSPGLGPFRPLNGDDPSAPMTKISPAEKIPSRSEANETVSPPERFIVLPTYSEIRAGPRDRSR